MNGKVSLAAIVGLMGTIAAASIGCDTKKDHLVSNPPAFNQEENFSLLSSLDDEEMLLDARLNVFSFLEAEEKLRYRVSHSQPEVVWITNNGLEWYDATIENSPYHARANLPLLSALLQKPGDSIYIYHHHFPLSTVHPPSVRDVGFILLMKGNMISTEANKKVFSRVVDNYGVWEHN